ncbi:hypothetical protein SAMN05216571_105163 [Onishia taeanensis]|jgi:hypothetical protein|uniref:Uncharacterized protein n=1 Tax=Onishia taeanensis TaxID=284577 RepID=A0A1G7S471_9GAMM|nr:hypothetical protein [Halomonas taeanensis]MAX32943.1 hypothetical protein [Halomonadaceae bacterium]SDG16940.1 hypothetical protein SAMN05216571_105163 [Halomonas taeanensis]
MKRQLTLAALVVAILPMAAQASIATQRALEVNQAAPEQVSVSASRAPVADFRINDASASLAEASHALIAKQERQTHFSTEAQAESLSHAQAATR